jgi:uncharacterized membrane protein YccF (DUF307 family)
MKICKYCAEEIREKAVVCRYCGLDLGNKITLSLAQKRHLLAVFRTIVNILWFILAFIWAIFGYLFLIAMFFG